MTQHMTGSTSLGGTERTLETMRARHAVRAYTDEPVTEETLTTLRAEIETINAASGLDFQMTAGLPDAFMGLKTHYGRFSGVHNAAALLGSDGTGRGDTLQTLKDADGEPSSPEAAALQERVGYWGERLALRMTELGLATSWAVLDGADGLDAADTWWTPRDNEALVWVLAFGHAARAGAKHRSKPMEKLTDVAEDAMPEWFRAGMEAAMLAPTSLSQQPFKVTLVETPAGGFTGDGENDGDHSDGGAASADSPEPKADIVALPGLFAHVGVGTAKWHFEAVAGAEHCAWRM